MTEIKCFDIFILFTEKVGMLINIKLIVLKFLTVKKCTK